MKINHNKNQKNKQIFILTSEPIPKIQNKIKIEEENVERERTKLVPVRVPKLRSVELIFSASLLVSLYRTWTEHFCC